MAKKEPSSKTLLYTYDPDEKYTYNTKHGTEYPYNGFPTGLHGRKYKKTRFINWEPIPEDIIIRHSGSQIFVNFEALFPNDVIDPSVQVFQLRAKRVDLQNYICEQINERVNNQRTLNDRWLIKENNLCEHEEKEI